MDTRQVIASLAALQLIGKLRARHGEVLLHQADGCCDSSSLMCFSVDDFIAGEHDVLLGELDQTAFYISADQFKRSRHTQLIVDTAHGHGASFSLDSGEEQRFVLRSRAFSDEELAALRSQGRL